MSTLQEQSEELRRAWLNLLREIWNALPLPASWKVER